MITCFHPIKELQEQLLAAASHVEELEQLKRDFAQQQQREKIEHETDLEQLRIYFEKKLRDAEKSYQEDLTLLQQRLQEVKEDSFLEYADISSSSTFLEEMAEKERKEHLDQLKLQLEQHEESLMCLQAQLEEKHRRELEVLKSSLEIQHEEEMTKVRMDLADKHLAETQVWKREQCLELERLRAALSGEHIQELTRMRLQHTQDVASEVETEVVARVLGLENEYKVKFSLLQTELKEEMELLKIENRNLHEKLQHEIHLREDVEKAKCNSLEEHQEEVRKTKEKVQLMRQEFKEKEEEWEVTREDLKRKAEEKLTLMLLQLREKTESEKQAIIDRFELRETEMRQLQGEQAAQIQELARSLAEQQGRLKQLELGAAGDEPPQCSQCGPVAEAWQRTTLRLKEDCALQLMLAQNRFLEERKEMMEKFAAEHDAALQVLQEKHVGELQLLQDSHRQHVVSLTTELQAEHQAEMGALRTTLQSEQRVLLETHAAELQTRQAEELSTLEAKHLSNLDSLESCYLSAIQMLRDEHRQALQQLSVDLEEQLRKKDALHQVVLTQELEQLKLKHEGELQGTKDSLRIEMSTKHIESLKAMAAELQRAHQEELAAALHAQRCLLEEEKSSALDGVGTEVVLVERRHQAAPQELGDVQVAEAQTPQEEAVQSELEEKAALREEEEVRERDSEQVQSPHEKEEASLSLQLQEKEHHIQQLKDQITSLSNEIEECHSALEKLQQRCERENQEGANLISVLKSDIDLSYNERNALQDALRRLLSLFGETLRAAVAMRSQISERVGLCLDDVGATDTESLPEVWPSVEVLCAGDCTGEHAAPTLDEALPGFSTAPLEPDGTPPESAEASAAAEISSHVCESFFMSPEATLEYEQPVRKVYQSLRVAVNSLLEMALDSSRQLEEARQIHSRFEKEFNYKNEETAQVIRKQKELLDCLNEESAATAALTRELHQAHGVIEGFKEERADLQAALDQKEQSEQRLVLELEHLGRQLQVATQEQARLKEECAALQSQKEVLAAGAQEREAGLRKEVECLTEEHLETRKQCEKDRAALLSQLRMLESELEEQVSRHQACAQHAEEVAALKQQMASLDKHLRSQRQFMDEQAAEREHERDEFQQEIQRLEEELRQATRPQATGAHDGHQSTQPSEEVELLQEKLREKSDGFNELAVKKELADRWLAVQREEIQRLEAAVAEAGRRAAQLQKELETQRRIGEESQQDKELLKKQQMNHLILVSALQTELEEAKCHVPPAGSPAGGTEAQPEAAPEGQPQCKREVLDLKEQLEEVKDNLASKNEEILHLTLKLDVQAQHTAASLRELQEENAHLKAFLHSKEEEIVSMREQLQVQPDGSGESVEREAVCDRSPEVEELKSIIENLQENQARLQKEKAEEIEQLHEVIEKLQKELSPGGPVTPEISDSPAESLRTELERELLGAREVVAKDLAEPGPHVWALQAELEAALVGKAALCRLLEEREQGHHQALEALGQSLQAAEAAATRQLAGLRRSVALKESALEALASRLAEFEDTLREKEALISEKDLEISALSKQRAARLAELEAMLVAVSGFRRTLERQPWAEVAEPPELQALRAQCAHLGRQLQTMSQRFLLCQRELGRHQARGQAGARSGVPSGTAAVETVCSNGSDQDGGSRPMHTVPHGQDPQVGFLLPGHGVGVGQSSPRKLGFFLTLLLFKNFHGISPSPMVTGSSCQWVAVSGRSLWVVWCGDPVGGVGRDILWVLWSVGQPQLCTAPSPPHCTLARGQPQLCTAPSPPHCTRALGQPQLCTAPSPPHCTRALGQPQLCTAPSPPHCTLAPGQAQLCSLVKDHQQPAPGCEAPGGAGLVGRESVMSVLAACQKQLASELLLVRDEVLLSRENSRGRLRRDKGKERLLEDCQLQKADLLTQVKHLQERLAHLVCSMTAHDVGPEGSMHPPPSARSTPSLENSFSEVSCSDESTDRSTPADVSNTHRTTWDVTEVIEYPDVLTGTGTSNVPIREKMEPQGSPLSLKTGLQSSSQGAEPPRSPVRAMDLSWGSPEVVRRDSSLEPPPSLPLTPCSDAAGLRSPGSSLLQAGDSGRLCYTVPTAKGRALPWAGSPLAEKDVEDFVVTSFGSQENLRSSPLGAGKSDGSEKSDGSGFGEILNEGSERIEAPLASPTAPPQKSGRRQSPPVAMKERAVHAKQVQVMDGGKQCESTRASMRSRKPSDPALCHMGATVSVLRLPEQDVALRSRGLLSQNAGWGLLGGGPQGFHVVLVPPCSISQSCGGIVTSVSGCLEEDVLVTWGSIKMVISQSCGGIVTSVSGCLEEDVLVTWGSIKMALLKMVCDESHHILALSEHRGAPSTLGRGEPHDPPERGLGEGLGLMEAVPALGAPQKGEEEPSDVCVDWRGAFLRAVQDAIEKERHALGVELQSRLGCCEPGDGSSLLERLEKVVREQGALREPSVESLCLSERSSLLSEVQALRAQLRMTHLQNQEKMQQLCAALTSTEARGSRQEHQLRRQVELLAYKVEQEKCIASDLQKTLSQEQEKVTGVRKLLVSEQNAVRDLKTELCECKQENERLLKSLSDVQKEVLQLRSMLDSKEKDLEAALKELEAERRKEHALQSQLEEEQLQHLQKEGQSSQALEVTQGGGAAPPSLVPSWRALGAGCVSVWQHSGDGGGLGRGQSYVSASCSQKVGSSLPSAASCLQKQRLEAEVQMRSQELKREREVSSGLEATVEALQTQKQELRCSLEKEREKPAQLQAELEQLHARLREQDARKERRRRAEPRQSRADAEKWKKWQRDKERLRELELRRQRDEHKIKQLQRTVRDLQLREDLHPGGGVCTSAPRSAGHAELHVPLELSRLREQQEQLESTRQQLLCAAGLLTSFIHQTVNRTINDWTSSNEKSVASLLRTLEELKSDLSMSTSTQKNTAAQLQTQLVDVLLKDNDSLTKVLSTVTQEKAELCKAVSKLEKTLKHHLHKGCTLSKPGRAAWKHERMAPQGSPRHADPRLCMLAGNEEAATCSVKMEKLYLHYLRAESFRKALIYQKKYLLLLIGGFQDSEQETLSMIAHLGVFPSKPDKKATASRPFTKFRTAVRVVVAILRLRFLVKKWQEVDRKGTLLRGTALRPAPLASGRVTSSRSIALSQSRVMQPSLAVAQNGAPSARCLCTCPHRPHLVISGVSACLFLSCVEAAPYPHLSWCPPGRPLTVAHTGMGSGQPHRSEMWDMWASIPTKMCPFLFLIPACSVILGEEAPMSQRQPPLPETTGSPPTRDASPGLVRDPACGTRPTPTASPRRKDRSTPSPNSRSERPLDAAQDPEHSLTEYIHHLELIQQRLGGLPSDSTSKKSCRQKIK
ncbi:pericentrin [Trichechus manatus latirostris]|uniref:Pericentrin n=1 Tax=Trichechus manatus latirostris TaxID=127582 RepID=A0A2Y9RT99_TRIMA|nr:pericentrin [Trichechus manatus latirostris]